MKIVCITSSAPDVIIAFMNPGDPFGMNVGQEDTFFELLIQFVCLYVKIGLRKNRRK